MIYTSVIIAKLLYAASAWWGFTTASDRQRLEALIKRGIRSGLCDVDASTLTEMVDSADDALYQGVLYNPNHVLHLLLPDLNATGHYLRHRRHDRVLPPKTGRLQNNFLIRQLRVYITRINSHRFNYICLARSFLKLFCILSFHHLCLLFLLSEVRFVIFLINEYWILDIGIHAHVQMPIATAYSTVARIQASTVASSERYIRASTMQSNSLIPQENMSTILNALESHNTPKFRR